MLKKLKKHSKKFFIAFSICLVSILTLFASTKTYAYDYNSNTNHLVGNDLLDWSNTTILFGNSTNSNNNVVQDFNISDYIYIDNENFINFNAPTETQAVTSGRWYYTIRFNNLNYNFYNHNYTLAMVFDSGNMAVTAYSYTFYFGYQSVTSARTKYVTINSNPQLVPYFYGKSIQTLNLYENVNYTAQYNFFTFSVNSTYQNLYGTLRFKILLFDNNFNSSYVINNNQTFVPYDSVEQLQQDYATLQQQYNSLQQQYNTLQSAYSQIANDYQTVVDNYNSLQHQYDSLQTDYNNLQLGLEHLQLVFDIYISTHHYTDEEYNTLNSQYQSLQTTYNTLLYQYNNLLVSYNSLQNRYNELLAESTNAMYFALNGATANLYTDVSGTKTLLASDTVSINQYFVNFDNSCIPNINTYLNDYDSTDSFTYPNPYCYIEIELNMSVNSSLLFTFDNSILDIDITLSSTISDVTTIYNRNSELNPYQLVVNSDRLSFNKITYDGIYMPDYISIDFSLQLDGYSYSLGYEKGVASQQEYINSLNSNVANMQSSINTLRDSNQQLQEQLNNTFGWKNLFFAMADTPFKTVSNLLGFELFGLNLFTTFIGMITVFAIVWLLKKFI